MRDGVWSWSMRDGGGRVALFGGGSAGGHGRQRESAALIFGAVLAVMILLVQKSGFFTVPAKRPLSLAALGGSGRTSLAAPEETVLLTYLLKPDPSRPRHEQCSSSPDIQPEAKLQQAEYTRLLALRSCCTGSSMLLVADDETAALEGLSHLRDCLGLPVAVWSMPPPWDEVVGVVSSGLPVGEEEEDREARAREAAGPEQQEGQRPGGQRSALMVVMVASDPGVMLPWAADLRAAVAHTLRGMGLPMPASSHTGRSDQWRSSSSAHDAGEAAAAPEGPLPQPASQVPLTTEIFMVGLTPFGYERSAGAAAGALFEPLHWQGYDVTLLSHPLSPARSTEPRRGGGSGGGGSSAGAGPLPDAGADGLTTGPGRGSGSPAAVGDAPLESLDDPEGGPSLELADETPRGSRKLAASPSNASSLAAAASDPSATLQFAAAEGRLPVSPVWLDWVGAGAPQQWLGVHCGPGFVGETVQALAARPTSLEPPRVVWTTGRGLGGQGRGLGDSGERSAPAALGVTRGAQSHRSTHIFEEQVGGARQLDQQQQQQQQREDEGAGVDPGLRGAGTRQGTFPGQGLHGRPALRVDGQVLTPGGTAARSAWLLWAAPSHVVASTLHPPTPHWRTQILAYSAWRSVVTADAGLLAGGGTFFKRAGGVEAEVQHLLSSIAAAACRPGAPSLLVDVGANAGYFSYLAALQGCHVLALEPQQSCRGLLHFTRGRNPATVGRRVRPVPFGVSSEALAFDASWGGACNGGYQLDEAAVRSAAQNALFSADAAAGASSAAVRSAPRHGAPVDVASELTKTYTRTGDDIVGAALSSLASSLPRGTFPSLVALKVDVEGSEVHVLQSLGRTLRSAQLFHLVVEVAPRKWPLSLKASDALRVLADLLDAYTALVLPDAEYPPESAGWDTRTVFGRTYPRVPGKRAMRALLRNRIDRGRGTNLYFALKIFEG